MDSPLTSWVFIDFQYSVWCISLWSASSVAKMLFSRASSPNNLGVWELLSLSTRVFMLLQCRLFSSLLLSYENTVNSQQSAPLYRLVAEIKRLNVPSQNFQSFPFFHKIYFLAFTFLKQNWSLGCLSAAETHFDKRQWFHIRSIEPICYDSLCLKSFAWTYNVCRWAWCACVFSKFS